eukprot:COSAG06_NODE_8082_length_2277_cov_4.285354_2_plen_60_part_00
MGVLGTTHLLPFRSSQSLPDCSACGPAPTKRNGTKRNETSPRVSCHVVLSEACLGNQAW